MSIANLENRGILNAGKQIIQRPIAFDKNEEISIYEVNFNNVDDTGTLFNGVLGATINEGTSGYLPSRDGTGIQILENGVYNILLQTKNLETYPLSNDHAKYLFNVKISLGNTIVGQSILDLDTQGVVNIGERVVFDQHYLNVNSAPYYFKFDCQCINGSQVPNNFSSFFTITRVK